MRGPGAARHRFSVFLISLLLTAPTPAATSFEAQLHATLEHTALSDTVPIPLPRRAAGLEARLLGKLESDHLRLSLRPILPLRWEDAGAEVATVHQGYLSQWQLRAALPENLAFSLGREVLHWGPAQFRSPASPFYFDNGRTNPARELGGMDAVRLAWTPSRAFNASLAWVQDSGHASAAATNITDPWRNTALVRGEWRGDDATAGLALARPQGRGAYVGGYGQWTVTDAWMLYGEAASSAESATARRGRVLLGASLTFENGHSLALEALYDGHAFDPISNPAAATPGRRYLHLLWQTNALDQGDYLRLALSRDLEDGGQQWTAYLDHPLGPGLNAYALAVLNQGGPNRTFSALVEHSFLVGLRWSLP